MIKPECDMKRIGKRNFAGKAIVYTGLILFAIWTLLPFLIVVSTSFKTYEEAISAEFHLFPQKFSLEGYRILFEAKTGSGKPMILTGFLNTLLVAALPVVVGTLVSAVSAYAFAKLRFPCKNFLFTVLIGTMLVPSTLLLIPSYMIYNRLNWLDTWLPLIVPGTFGGAACVFFLRQFYTGIPNELLEAAKVDGVGYFGAFFRIILPLSKAAVFAQMLIIFIAQYNDYVGPRTYLLNEEDLFTLQFLLTRFLNSNWSDYHAIMASSIVAMLPTMVLYLFTQKYFIEGIASSGLKD